MDNPETSATCGIQHTAERQRHIQIIAVMYQLFRLVFMQLPKLCQRIYVVFDMKYHMIYVITWIPVIMWALVCIWYMGTCTSHTMGTSNNGSNVGTRYSKS